MGYIGRPGIGLVMIRQINSPYHTKINKYIASISVYTLIPLSVTVALATGAVLSTCLTPTLKVVDVSIFPFISLTTLFCTFFLSQNKSGEEFHI